MARSNWSPEDKMQVVLAVLRGVSVMEAATGAGVNERTVRRWRQAVMEGGRDRLASGERASPARELELEAENEQLKVALGEAHMQTEELKAALGEAHLQLRQRKRGME